MVLEQRCSLDACYSYAKANKLFLDSEIVCVKTLYNYIDSMLLVLPYSSWERGSNERHKGLLRRFISKGKRIDKYTSDDILFTADWCNSLPRKILGYKIPDDLFDNELDKIYAV